MGDVASARYNADGAQCVLGEPKQGVVGPHFCQDSLGGNKLIVPARLSFLEFITSPSLMMHVEKPAFEKSSLDQNKVT